MGALGGFDLRWLNPNPGGNSGPTGWDAYKAAYEQAFNQASSGTRNFAPGAYGGIPDSGWSDARDLSHNQGNGPISSVKKPAGASGGDPFLDQLMKMINGAGMGGGRYGGINASGLAAQAYSPVLAALRKQMGQLSSTADKERARQKTRAGEVKAERNQDWTQIINFSEAAKKDNAANHAEMAAKQTAAWQGAQNASTEAAADQQEAAAAMQQLLGVSGGSQITDAKAVNDSTAAAGKAMAEDSAAALSATGKMLDQMGVDSARTEKGRVSTKIDQRLTDILAEIGIKEQEGLQQLQMAMAQAQAEQAKMRAQLAAENARLQAQASGASGALQLDKAKMLMQLHSMKAGQMQDQQGLAWDKEKFYAELGAKGSGAGSGLPGGLGNLATIADTVGSRLYPNNPQGSQAVMNAIQQAYGRNPGQPDAKDALNFIREANPQFYQQNQGTLNYEIPMLIQYLLGGSGK